MTKKMKVLFIDAYDSFSNSIMAMIIERLSVQVQAIKIDDERFFNRKIERVMEQKFFEFIQNFDAVIAGPGPGNPVLLKDVGVIASLWKQTGDNIVPILGVCLGHQSLGLAFGCEIRPLVYPCHGIGVEVYHNNTSIFKDSGTIMATLYHSLFAFNGLCEKVLNHKILVQDKEMFKPTTQCPYLIPLAWYKNDATIGMVPMAFKHISLPYYGVQFHPESICTNENGKQLLNNWWKEVTEWNKVNRKETLHRITDDTLKTPNQEQYSEQQNKNTTNDIGDEETKWDKLVEMPDQKFRLGRAGYYSNRVMRKMIEYKDVQLKDIFTKIKLFDKHGEGIIFQSATWNENIKPTKVEEAGRFSLLGFVDEATLRLYYFIQSNRLEWRNGLDEVIYESRIENVWEYMKAFMSSFKIEKEICFKDIPFIGGLMGYISYEFGLKSIGVAPSKQRGKEEQPGLVFALVLKSVVVDHVLKKIYIQSLCPDDEEWVDNTFERIKDIIEGSERKEERESEEEEEDDEGKDDELVNYRRFVLKELEKAGEIDSKRQNLLWKKWGFIIVPKEEDYQHRVEQTQEYLKAGESYEICLTDQSVIYIKGSEIDWNSIYDESVKRTSAPFSALFRVGSHLGQIRLISCSPEKFLSWDRDGKVEMRPIKGTMKKDKNTTIEMANKFFEENVKERAENLMILDLIRHDLYGALGYANVHVKKCMGVEEYRSVFQLVSVVEGNAQRIQSQSDQNDSNSPSGQIFPILVIPNWEFVCQLNRSNTDRDFVTLDGKVVTEESCWGLDVLSCSLPPGSMTGAPKKRSCEILKNLEGDRPRNVYSGVLGYFDLASAGQFSVIIRTVCSSENDHFELNEEFNSSTPNKIETFTKLYLGAGGAITVLSNAQEEYIEMCNKRDYVLNVISRAINHTLYK